MTDQENTIFGWKIVQHPLENEITQSYIDYAMSVIASRALPDTRDGFKPVLRRILFAMYEMKMFHNTKHKKSARIVWEVLWKYHPHGDSSVYEAMVRMSQTWSLRYPLVDGQGNFWSLDWDSAAAMRYTEARLTKLAEEMAADIYQDTVDWRDNFDWSLQEPIMMPTKFPNHLCNGTMGIAVWMATNMAPHNLTEVLDACKLIVDKEWKVLTEEQKNLIQKNIQDKVAKKVLLVDAVHTLFNKVWEDFEINTELADYLRWLNCRKIIVTNAEEEKLKPLLTNYPDFELFTLNFSPEKTDPQYFKTLIKNKKLDVSEVIYFDHNTQNIESAVKAGIEDTILFKENTGLIGTLQYKLFEQPNIHKEDKYNVSIDEIMTIIKGPDFPTGWVMFDSNNIREVYKKGRGGIAMRGKIHIEEVKNHKNIVIDEIPYMVNKSTLVSKIWELVVDKKIEWITDITDESSKDIIRIVIQLRKWANADRILVQLYKRTDLQCNFNINNVTLVEKGRQPRTLNIKDLLMEFVDFRRSVIFRRSNFQLKKAQDRLHILEWLKKAIDVIDAVIETIKKSDTKQDAKLALMESFEFSDEQAEYILMLRLQSLVWLEIQKITEEIEEKRKLIEYLQWIISDPEKLDWVFVEEIEYMRNKFGDDRRTELSEDTSIYNLSWSLKSLRDAADQIKEDVILRMWNDYSIRTVYQTRIQNIPEETLDLVYTHNQDKMVVITDLGELVVHRLKDFWSFTMTKDALNLKKHFWLKGKIVFAKTLDVVGYDHLLFLTKNNNIKKIDKDLLLSFKKFPTIVMKLAEKEKIAKVLWVKDGDKVWIVTEQWQGLIFPTAELRPMWKTAGWVKAIDLPDGDKVANMFLYQDEMFIMIHTDQEAKLLNVKDDLRVWKRARKWDSWVKGKFKIEWWFSMEEWSIRMRFTDGSLQTLHSDSIRLDEPDTPLVKIVDKKIELIYIPWEEKEENFKHKEEQKAKKKEQDQKDQEGLF